ncbi:DUF3035 domain-containing protein [Actibacterium lipolyticum]|uniref:DUF3035 domain-containing protein n=1 Tax=Actibacterium lipolyticum TaxID=1524263 RepID=A0A238KTW3_9RHOB|nr:DUF3035 domain-containing protein [Actibacterium lipolyticum]SMX46239.1 hypothetical protein COL8621_03020 [Actibacterium lipolyticum]
MRGARLTVLMVLTAGLALAGCSGDKQPELMNIRSTNSTPDEFAILPVKPLEIPEDLAALPAPTPGGANRTDPSPAADAIAALGGNPARLAQTGVPSSESALVSQATRFGVAGDIRQTLAAEDLEFRRKNDGRLLERLFNVSVYYRAYRAQSLDQHAELARWRRAGARTVGAPPSQ